MAPDVHGVRHADGEQQHAPIDAHFQEPWEIDAGLHDLWNTMLLPSLLLLLARFAPGLVAPPPPSPPPESER